MNRIQHLFILVWAGYRQNTWMMFPDIVGLSAKAAGNDYPAIFLERFANGIKAFGLGRVEKTAGVYDHRICTSIVG